MRLSRSKLASWNAYLRKYDKCKACELCETRLHTVHLRGDIPARVAFVGEAPGRDEDIMKEPFIGPAGQRLNEIIKDCVNLNGERIAFLNILACVPLDENQLRAPRSDEASACLSRLNKLLEIVQPAGLITLGDVPKKFIKDTKFWEHKNMVRPRRIFNAPHPARFLRLEGQGQPQIARTLQETMINDINEFVARLPQYSRAIQQRRPLRHKK